MGLSGHPSAQSTYHCGRLREDPVVIRNPRYIDELIFLPPDAKEVPKLLQHLLDFVNENIHVLEPIVLVELISSAACHHSSFYGW